MTSDSDTRRRLILLRHAKSDWPDVPDHDRPLAKRGRKDAPVIGRWLDRHGYVPDTVICSTARRTRQTWELMAPELDGTPEVRFEPRAYAASALTLLLLARELPSQSRAVLLIAHNPGIEELANSLDAQPGEDTESRSQGLRFPTAAVAVFGYVGDWPGLALGQARLLDSTTPADLKALTPWTREARPPPGPPPAAAARARPPRLRSCSRRWSAPSHPAKRPLPGHGGAPGRPGRWR